MSDKIDWTTIPLILCQSTTSFTLPRGTNYYPNLSDIVILNRGGFTVSGTEITVTDSGIYNINANLISYNTSQIRLDCLVEVNGVEMFGQSFNQQYGKLSISSVYNLSSGDKIKLLMLNNELNADSLVQKFNIAIRKI